MFISKHRVLLKLKKDLVFALIFWLLASIVVPILGLAAPVERQVWKQKFLVSAYYSPLPGQKRYLRGTYEKDIRLNGQGIAGADRTPVYIGMLAAPKNYAFGTQIFIPGLGVGTVHDRGGAILSREEYDRIDVWMGYGDEGLTRALNWGMRMVVGEIYASNQLLVDNIDYSWIPSNYTPPQVVKNEGPFNQNYGRDATGDGVKLLQEKLKTLGYFTSQPTGKYDLTTVEGVYAFQKAQEIVTGWDDFGAGYFGNQTRKELNKIIIQKEYEIALKEQKQPIQTEEVEATKLLITAGLGKDSEGEDVQKLQLVLKELGYYTGEINGKYDHATIEAVLVFQKDNSVINDATDFGAGFFGPQTKKTLEKVLAQKEVELNFGDLLASVVKLPTAPKMEIPTENQVSFGNLLSQNSFQITAFAIPNLNLKQVLINTQVGHVEERSMVFEPAQKTELISSTLTLGDSGQDVKKLQAVLIDQGYLNLQTETGFFGEITKEALIQYQIEKEIIHSIDNPGAGVLGPMTRQSLNASSGLFAGISGI